MADTLNQVQENIHAQLLRDYGKDSTEHIAGMLFFGLGEETGEVLGIAKRNARRFERDTERLSREHFVEELGDVLWYLVALCDVHDISLDEVWEANKLKLEARYG